MKSIEIYSYHQFDNETNPLLYMWKSSGKQMDTR